MLMLSLRLLSHLCFEIVFFLLFGIMSLVNDLYDIKYMGIPFCDYDYM